MFAVQQFYTYIQIWAVVALPQLLQVEINRAEPKEIRFGLGDEPTLKSSVIYSTVTLLARFLG